MKINKLWIPMIIFGIIGGIAKLCDTIFNDHNAISQSAGNGLAVISG